MNRKSRPLSQLNLGRRHPIWGITCLFFSAQPPNCLHPLYLQNNRPFSSRRCFISRSSLIKRVGGMVWDDLERPLECWRQWLLRERGEREENERGGTPGPRKILGCFAFVVLVSGPVSTIDQSPYCAVLWMDQPMLQDR
jgi:hypothetical protein